MGGSLEILFFDYLYDIAPVCAYRKVQYRRERIFKYELDLPVRWVLYRLIFIESR